MLTHFGRFHCISNSATMTTMSKAYQIMESSNPEKQKQKKNKNKKKMRILEKFRRIFPFNCQPLEDGEIRTKRGNFQSQLGNFPPTSLGELSFGIERPSKSCRMPKFSPEKYDRPSEIPVK